MALPDELRDEAIEKYGRKFLFMYPNREHTAEDLWSGSTGSGKRLPGYHGICSACLCGYDVDFPPPDLDEQAEHRNITPKQFLDARYQQFECPSCGAMLERRKGWYGKRGIKDRFYLQAWEVHSPEYVTLHEAIIALEDWDNFTYITAYETYGEQGLKQYGQLGITKLVALAQLNEEDRTEMLESGKADELSTRLLNDEIKRLKGENDQLRFQFDDITDNVKKQDAEIADKDAEIENLKNQLEEAQRPIVASMTNEEKEEIRREAEKKARADADKKVERWKNMRDKDAKTYQKAIKDYETDAENREGIIEDLKKQLEAAKAENEKLHANAEKTKPAPSGNKELLKYHFAALQNDYIKAVEVLGRFEPEEREKFKAALVKIAEDIKAAVEKM